jgi:excisionase family DNA binding protein
MYTPPQIAEKLKIGHSKVLDWIRSGELAAVNVSSGKQPRFRVSEESLQAFITRRSQTQVVTIPQSLPDPGYVPGHVRYVA